MKFRDFNQSHKDFYHNLKKSLQNGSNHVLGTNNRNIDFVVINMKQDIQLFKIVTPENKDCVDFWIKDLKGWYKLAWYRANYNLIFIDEVGVEIKRDKISLN